jgi:alkanesulfonate monooxygenase SsuD/methylene tetrahydromethanopterin reductase-like flavin-dependent oxidoreductase (luciferase family)
MGGVVVKLLMFHLMPYPQLPEDFSEQVHGVWVDVPSRFMDPAVVAECYREYLDQLEYAASAGFDGICVNEHHQNAYGLMPSPNLMAAILSQRTSGCAIVVLGASLALYNPPTRVAEEFAMLDCLSGGRLVAGFPVGTPMDTTYCYGQNPATLRTKYGEAHDLVMRAWAEPEPFAFNGAYTKLRYVNVWPRPLQRPHPPVWVPGSGSVETWSFTAEHSYVYCYLSYFGHQAGLATMNGYWRHMEQIGASDNPYQAGFLQFVGVGDTDAEAYRLYKEPAEYFYNRCLHLWPGFSDPPGYASEETVRAKGEGMISRVAKSTAKPTWDEMIERGYVIIGGPDTVREKLEDVARTLRVGHLMVLLQFGNMGADVARNNIDLFGRKVKPLLTSVFDEYEDAWWPASCA